MNKKHLSITIVMLVMTILVAGCGAGRDLSTPSTRIVGHWGYFKQEESDPEYEIYHGEFDEDGIAPCFWRDSEGTFTYTCRIISESGFNLTLGIEEAIAPPPDEDVVQFYLPEDGQYLRWSNNLSVGVLLQYIDSKTEP